MSMYTVSHSFIVPEGNNNRKRKSVLWFNLLIVTSQVPSTFLIDKLDDLMWTNEQEDLLYFIINSVLKYHTSKTVKMFQYFSIGIQLHIFPDWNGVRPE